MPIVVEYGADPKLMAQAAAQGSGAAVAAEQDWRERQLAESQYQSDRDNDWRVQSAALQDRLARYEMGNRTALSFAGLQSQNYNNQLDYELGQQQLAQRDEQLGVQAAIATQQQQQLTDRTRLQQLGQLAKQQQEQKFQTFMAERKNFEDNIHRYTPLQQQAFREGLSQKYGIDYSAPEQIMAADEEQAYQDRVSRIRQAFANPFDPEQSLLPPGAEEWALQLTPKELMDVSIKAQSEERQRRQLQQKEGEADRKTHEKTVANAKDIYKYGQQAQGDYLQAEAEYKADVAEYENKKAAHEMAITEWEQAKKEWAAQPAPAEGKPKKPFTTARPSFTEVPPVAPLPMQFAGSTGFPVARSVAEVQQKLASGEWAEGTPFLTPDGQIMFAKLRQQ